MSWLHEQTHAEKRVEAQIRCSGLSPGIAELGAYLTDPSLLFRTHWKQRTHFPSLLPPITWGYPRSPGVLFWGSKSVVDRTGSWGGGSQRATFYWNVNEVLNQGWWTLFPYVIRIQCPYFGYKAFVATPGVITSCWHQTPASAAEISNGFDAGWICVQILA